jgi:hypothetical protein
MAKLQLSVIASGISGKHSGGVFLKGNGGVNIRKKVRPMQTASDYQANVKSRLTLVQSMWSTLSSGQLKAWNLLAKMVKSSNVFGDKFALSGISLFQRLNNNLNSISIPFILDAPVLANVPTLFTFSITVTHLGVISVVFTTSPMPAGISAIFSLTAPISKTRQVRNSDFRILSVGNPGVASPLDLSALYVARFGSIIPAGTTVHCRAKLILHATGQAGLPMQCSAIVS